MKKTRIIFLLAALLLLIPAVAGAQAGSSAISGSAPEAQEPVDLSAAIASGLRISTAAQTGLARFVWLTADQAAQIQLKAGGKASPQKQAQVFFGDYGALFGIKDAGTELVLASQQTDSLGMLHLSYNQVYRGLPVFAGVLRVHFDRQGLITSANGIFIPQINLIPKPTISAATAAEVAVLQVNTPGVAAVKITLLVFRENLARGIPGANHLAYEVEVGNGLTVREFIYIDAHNGAVIDRISGINDLNRQIFNQSYDKFNPIWQEGDPLPFYSADMSEAANRDANRAIDYVEDTYQMVLNATGGTYLSFDGEDAIMKQVIDDQTPDFCPNASWNGQFVRYCIGITGDDTVAHEWGHAYTQKTNPLVYQWEPGAINESYSDIFGEVVDMINGAGLDDPDLPRTDGVCSVYTPKPVYLEVQAPEAIAGDYKAGPAAFGPPIDGTTVGSLMIADDGTAAPTEACSPIINDLTGKIAFIRRGNCTFVSKALNAQAAGAIGVVIANHQTGGDDVFTMSGYDENLTIQSLMIGYTDGNTIEETILGGSDVVVRLAVNEPAQVDDSYRWLSGEQDDGGAIRDLWNPPCYNNPDKISSEYFTCSTDDAGGVHTNSGISNHAFALLVDGGNFNGQSISGIGLSKAFQFFWRANTIYQTPTTGFADHADALLQSCHDLTGSAVMDVATGLPLESLVSESDCAELEKVIAAVEYHTDPVCTRTPMATYRHRVNREIR